MRYTVYAMDIATFNILGDTYITNDLNKAIKLAKDLLKDYKYAESDDNIESIDGVVSFIDDNTKMDSNDWVIMSFGYLSPEEIKNYMDGRIFNGYEQISELDEDLQKKPKNVLYLHGLGSGASTTTGRCLKKIMSNYNVITIDLFHNIGKSMDIIYKAIEDYDIDIMIGTSLGGYFTLVSEFDGIKLAINPVLDPLSDLSKFIGTHQYFVDRENGDTTYTFTKDDLKEYDGYELYLTPNTYVIESSHDELLGNNINKMKMLMNPYQEKDGNTHVFVTDKIGHRLTKSFINGDLRYILNDIINDISNDKFVLNSPDMSDGNIILESKTLNEYQYLNLWTDNRKGFVHSNDMELKEKYADEVWDLLSAAYAKIGGCKSFDDKEEMIEKADLWKLKIRGGVVTAVILYTTKKGGGRKLIAAGSKKSSNDIEALQSKDDLIKMIKDDCKFTGRNAWAEVSGIMEYYFRKFGAAVIPVEKARLILAKKSDSMVNIEDAKGIEIANNPKDIEKIPNKRGEHYVRPIGGHMHRKVMLGNYNDKLALESIQHSIQKGIIEGLSLMNTNDEISFSKMDYSKAYKQSRSQGGSSILYDLVQPYIDKTKKWKDFYDEALKLYNNFGATYQVKSRKDLQLIINRLVMKPERYDANLNWIDVSQIEDFSYLFYNSKFNGYIDKWNVTNGTNFRQMFSDSYFNQDISNWDINPKADTTLMFDRRKI